MEIHSLIVLVDGIAPLHDSASPSFLPKRVIAFFSPQFVSRDGILSKSA